MKNFLNVSAVESKKLHRPIYFNSKKLRWEATMLAEHESYSTAASLMILSIEELIKAILVLLHSEGYKVYRLDEANKFFKDHAIRHRLAQFIETGLSLLEVGESWSHVKSNDNLSSTFFKYFDMGKMIITSFKNSKDRLMKLEEFNSLKNLGFYVDFKDELKEPKTEVTRLHYLNTLDINVRIAEFYLKLKLLFHPSILKHMPEKKVLQYREDLHLIIDVVFKGYSFKSLKYNDK